jgi:hypothetical protein
MNDAINSDHNRFFVNAWDRGYCFDFYQSDTLTCGSDCDSTAGSAI